MNPRKPYRPRRRVPSLPGAEPEPAQKSGGCGLFLVLLLAVAAAGWFWLRPRALNLLPALAATAPHVDLLPSDTPLAPTAAATATPMPPEPTSTLYLEPSPSPTAIMTPVPTQLYTTQSGDTLPALAARFGINPADISAPAGRIRGDSTLNEGQLLVIPSVLEATGPGYKIIPDSELVYSGGGAGFSPARFATEQNGYLAQYKGFAESRTRSGGDLVLLIAQNHSINPRLIVALLEYQSGWVTQAQLSDRDRQYPMGYVNEMRKDLFAQVSWATTQLATGYYGWRAGTLTELRLADGSTVRLDPTLNAGTVGVQYFFSLTLDQAAWEAAVGPDGLAATYRQFFGDPFSRAVDPLIPGGLTQPHLTLPFLPGLTWYFSGGPHGAWQRGGAMAALDFAPASFEGGCAESDQWVTAMAAGKVVRSEAGVVVLDLDGDGREATGWAILYLHIAEKNRVPAGQFLERGDKIGHPSCEGGTATGTHVHVARKYNGEWILADGLVPFDMSGWVAQRGKGEYYGTLSRDGRSVEACPCTAAWTAITADPKR